MELGGAFLNNEFRFVALSVSECDNEKSSEDWNFTCAPKKAINDYLSIKGSLRFQLYTTNYVINP